MTLEVMFKKVNAYNEIAEITGEPKKALELVHYSSYCSCRLSSFKATSYSELKKAIKAEYIDSFSKELFACTCYEFYKERMIDDETIVINIVNA
jgi:hypothetical protein